MLTFDLYNAPRIFTFTSETTPILGNEYLFKNIKDTSLSILDSERSDECIDFTLLCFFFFCVCLCTRESV
ncbi:hypothetical protein FWK35_00002339 [Aphis craccivora]|uniref:Uncharacterized protein n=1 Tax=Aphis craccivora TaxID=307492 RepID=A0A6G0Z9V1_APHCR|nr:hypothetical protein FWK35_00002339 [Aphis craccivora]